MTPSEHPVVCSFESRRADEMTALIERQGGVAVVAPSMREIPIEDNPAAVDCIRQLIAGSFDGLILLTGVGTEALFEVARSQELYDDLRETLGRMPLIIRGPKPAAVLHRIGLKATVRAPEPNTWRELLTALDASALALKESRIAVQEYGVPNMRFYEELKRRGADVTAVPVYRWGLPEDMAPLEAAIRRIADRKTDIVLFTSANQSNHVLTVAERIGVTEPFRAALAACVVGSIGPTCSEALADQELLVHFEASPPKMGTLVRGAIDLWRSR